MEASDNTNVETGYSPRDLPPIGGRDNWRDVVQKLYADMAELFRKEGQLIRTEFQEKSHDIKEATTSAISAGVVLFIGLQLLAITAIVLLHLVTPLWVASVIVTLFFFVVGGLLIGTAMKKFKSTNLRPTKSIEALEHIRFSVKEKVNEITKH